MQIGKNVGKKCKDKIYSTASPKISNFSVSTPDGTALNIAFESDKEVYRLGLRVEAPLTFTKLKVGDVPRAIKESAAFSKTIKNGKHRYQFSAPINGSGKTDVILQLAEGENGKNGAVRRSGSVKLEDNDAGALL